jgi:glycosyltransferase involved in cell wall biosynthesis
MILNNFRIDCNKIKIIPNGIDKKEFEKYKVKKKKNNKILYVGRLEKYKGIQYIIKAISLLDKKIVLEIVGTGLYKHQLKKLAQNLDVDDRVFFTQNIDRKELIQKYYESGLFISLSKYEAYGITVLEALSTGTPCIVSNISSLSEWIDNKNCYGINYPINIQELKNMIMYLIGKNIKYEFINSWDEVVNKIKTLYDEI